MEFAIDYPTVRKIVASERRAAHDEIAALGPVAAYRNSLERHAARLAAAPDAATLACKSGCSWCCHFSVDVRPVEVINLLDHIERSIGVEERERIVREAAANHAMLASLSDLERAQRNVKCPFLVSDRCSIYTQRPETCRNYHATDATGCRLSFEHPENLDIDPDFAPLTYQIGGSHVDAFSAAMREAGYDVEAYELNAALTRAFASPQQTRERFEAKQKLFPDLQSSEPDSQFLEIADDEA